MHNLCFQRHTAICGRYITNCQAGIWMCICLVPKVRFCMDYTIKVSNSCISASHAFDIRIMSPLCSFTHVSNAGSNFAINTLICTCVAIKLASCKQAFPNVQKLNFSFSIIIRRLSQRRKYEITKTRRGAKTIFRTLEVYRTDLKCICPFRVLN